jgi:hypothetical protein
MPLRSAFSVQRSSEASCEVAEGLDHDGDGSRRPGMYGVSPSASRIPALWRGTYDRTDLVEAPDCSCGPIGGRARTGWSAFTIGWSRSFASPVSAASTTPCEGGDSHGHARHWMACRPERAKSRLRVLRVWWRTIFPAASISRDPRSCASPSIAPRASPAPSRHP